MPVVRGNPAVPSRSLRFCGESYSAVTLSPLSSTPSAHSASRTCTAALASPTSPPRPRSSRAPDRPQRATDAHGVNGLARQIDQRPVAHRWLIRLQEPIEHRTQMPVCLSSSPDQSRTWVGPTPWAAHCPSPPYGPGQERTSCRPSPAVQFVLGCPPRSFSVSFRFRSTHSDHSSMPVSRTIFMIGVLGSLDQKIPQSSASLYR